MTTSTTVPDPQSLHQQGQSHSLSPALDAELLHLTTSDGKRLSWYSDTSASGHPLVLVHSINAAPSSFELKPLFEHYRGQRPVYSLELPGFGQSERDAGPYSPQRFANAIREFLQRIVQQPSDVLALSLSAEFAVRAALEQPEQIRSLVLISPTGFSTRELAHPRIGAWAHRFLCLPGLSQGLYNLVASRASIRYYLGRSFLEQPPQEILDYAYATSHQPGARHAPLAFLSGLLFTAQPREQLYGRLRDIPVLAIADQDPYISFEELAPFVKQHPDWQLATLAPHHGLPQWERLPETIEALDGFWNRTGK